MVKDYKVNGNYYTEAKDQNNRIIATEHILYTSEWEHEISFNNGNGRLKYGFDTDWANEDTASAYHSTKFHQVQVKNDKYKPIGASAKVGKWTEVLLLKHASNPVRTAVS